MPDNMPFGLNPRRRKSVPGDRRKRPASVLNFKQLILALYLLSCCCVAVAIAEDPVPATATPNPAIIAAAQKESPARPENGPAATTAANTTDKSQSPTTSPQDPANRIDIDHLIEQLDSLNYQVRESAAAKLAEAGRLAIGPLALRSLECSPEQSWRIKKTLEKICTSGNEEDFFKAFGILQLRFDGGNVAMSQKMVELQNKWKLKRKQEAIEKLRTNGAVVTDPRENAVAAQQNIQFGNAIFLNGRTVGLVDDTPVVTTVKATNKKKTLSDEELRSRIEKILDSDLEENRELVLGANDAEPVNIPSSDPFDDQVIINRAVLIRGGFPRTYSQGISVNLTDQWSGKDQDLELLKAIPELTEVSIKDLDLSETAIASIARLPTLTKLVFDGSQLSPDKLDGSELSPNLRELEFANQEITNDLIEFCSTIRSLQKLAFDRCEMQDAVLDELKTLDRLRGLEFKKTEIDASLFNAIAELEQITAVTLSACKFKTRDFEELKSLRPRLQVSFTAQAFLGVRGPIDRFQMPDANPRDPQGCLISEVISGSGADKAGMKIGDVIQTVNRQPIATFDDLRLHIAQHLPGDKLKITVQRDDQPLELVVELGDIKSVPNN